MLPIGVEELLSTFVESYRKCSKRVTANVYRKFIDSIWLVENVKIVPEYAKILCKSVQTFQKGRKSSTLCILGKL